MASMTSGLLSKSMSSDNFGLNIEVNSRAEELLMETLVSLADVGCNDFGSVGTTWSRASSLGLPKSIVGVEAPRMVT